MRTADNFVELFSKLSEEDQNRLMIVLQEDLQKNKYEKMIEKAAFIISKRLVDEWYGSEEFPEDCQLFEEILCGLLQDNPEECERLIGTAFCEEEEVKDEKRS